jgi:threonine dehydrogenase-like Zn-dependent dehydrogenase
MTEELLLVGPRELRLVPYEEPPLGAGEARAQAVASGVSLGTELAAYRGTSPHGSRRFDAELRLFVESDEAVYPTTLGYEWVGVVREVGDRVSRFRIGDLVHLPLPHRRTHTFVADGDLSRLSPGVVPPGLDEVTASLLETTRIALGAVHDAQIKAGDHLVVFGLGTFGLLAVQLARLSGPAWIDAVDPIEDRRRLAETLGADRTFDPTACDVGLEIKASSEQRGADVAIEFSGQYAALHQALRCVRLAGAVVAAGFYQGGAEALRLGEEWHHNRLTLVSSMTGWGSPHRDHPRWDRLRLRSTAAQLLAGGVLRTDVLVTHRFPFERAAEAYALLDNRPDEVLRLVLTYR